MSRDPKHGGKGWEFSTCVWAPTQTEAGSDWPFWSKVGLIRKGDLIVHLQGIHPNAAFVGFSAAASDGYRTSDRPPILGQWDFATEFFRADLEDFNPFPTSIPLRSVFKTRNEELRHYFEANKIRPKTTKRNLFYVIQSNRLQCLNGAYLSDLDANLAEIILGSDFTGENLPRPVDVSIETGQRIQKIRARLGQSEFSERIKSNYNLRCCFPGCVIDDQRFLVGAHIARWADREDLRGRIDNGLCLCLIHDKAFEDGYFTLDESMRVIPLAKHSKSSVFRDAIEPFSGQTIAASDISPSRDSLREHWRRNGYKPTETNRTSL